MPRHKADEVLERLSRLIEHELAVIKREFVLQTLRCDRENRTHAAQPLGSSTRSMHEKNSQLQRPGRDCFGVVEITRSRASACCNRGR
jgi:DNA-binding NtrC family response regulator